MNRCVKSITKDTSSAINWIFLAFFLRTKSLACFLLGDVDVHHVRHISQWIAVKMFCFSVHHIELSLHLLHCDLLVFELPSDVRSRTHDGAIYPSSLSCRTARAATARSPSLVGAFYSHLKHCRQTLLHQLIQAQSHSLSAMWDPIRATNALLFARVIGHAAWSHDRRVSLASQAPRYSSSLSIKIAARYHCASCRVVKQLMPLPRVLSRHIISGVCPLLRKQSRTHADHCAHARCPVSHRCLRRLRLPRACSKGPCRQQKQERGTAINSNRNTLKHRSILHLTRTKHHFLAGLVRNTKNNERPQVNRRECQKDRRLEEGRDCPFVFSACSIVRESTSFFPLEFRLCKLQSELLPRFNPGGELAEHVKFGAPKPVSLKRHSQSSSDSTTDHTSTTKHTRS